MTRWRARTHRMGRNYTSLNTTFGLEYIVGTYAPRILASHPDLELHKLALRCIIIFTVSRLLGSGYPVLYGLVAISSALLKYQGSERGTAAHLVYSFAFGWVLIFGQLVYRLLRESLTPSLDFRKDSPSPSILEPSDNSPANLLKPLLFPSRTSHRRLIPTPHSFSYPYLLVGVPVSSTGASSSFLSMNDGRMSFEAWFSVHASDYLQRGPSYDTLSFREKLDSYLRSQGVHPDALPHAYLVTAPRFLGFCFNPVSFWYLYSKSYELGAMILEVNNTFDERRLYFLQSTHGGSDPSSQINFKAVWRKDFHVSPFNDRDGTYSVMVKDPLKHGRVDNTIVLRSHTGEAKVVARVFSTTRGINSDLMSPLQKTYFLLRWCWSGFLTHTRILKEARVLWVKNLQVFYRPEPRQGTIGRTATREEIVIERWFASFLDRAASQTTTRVVYRPAAGSYLGQAITLGSEAVVSHVDLEVLTPAFYSELARARGRFLGVILRHSSSDQTTRLITSSDPEALKEFVSKVPDCFSEQPVRYGWRTRASIWILGMDSSSRLATPLDWLLEARPGRQSLSPAYGPSKCATGETARFDGSDPGFDADALLQACLLIRCADLFALGSTSLLRTQLRFGRLVSMFLLTWLLFST